MAKEFARYFHWDVVAQAYSGGKGFSCYMVSDSLFDTSNESNLLDVVIKLLIADQWKPTQCRILFNDL